MKQRRAMGGWGFHRCIDFRFLLTDHFPFHSSYIFYDLQPISTHLMHLTLFNECMIPRIPATRRRHVNGFSETGIFTKDWPKSSLLLPRGICNTKGLEACLLCSEIHVSTHKQSDCSGNCADNADRLHRFAYGEAEKQGNQVSHLVRLISRVGVCFISPRCHSAMTNRMCFPWARSVRSIRQ